MTWVEIDEREWSEIVEREGGVRALAVFSTLTDPDGQFGQPQIYTAWGRKGDEDPLVDIRDLKSDDGETEQRTLRKFVVSGSGDSRGTTTPGGGS